MVDEKALEKVKGEELSPKRVGSALGSASHRLVLLLHWARWQRDELAGKPDWRAVFDTMEAVVFNLERAQALLHHEANVILREQELQEGEGSSDE